MFLKSTAMRVQGIPSSTELMQKSGFPDPNVTPITPFVSDLPPSSSSSAQANLSLSSLRHVLEVASRRLAEVRRMRQTPERGPGGPSSTTELHGGTHHHTQGEGIESVLLASHKKSKSMTSFKVAQGIDGIFRNFHVLPPSPKQATLLPMMQNSESRPLASC